MKPLSAFAVLLAFGAAFGSPVQARLAPPEAYSAAIASGDRATASNSSASQMELDYFRAPQSPPASEQLFPCRLQHVVFEKTRLAQSCR
jgi:hypothetical protein